MARFLAMEWDAAEARVVVAKNRGSSISVEQAFVLPLDGIDVESATAVGEKLSAELSSRGLTKQDLLVGLGRQNIELRLLQLPDAPENELPDMVRLMATQQFTAIGNEWPIDFNRIDAMSGENGQINVLAAVISPKVVKYTNAISEACEMKPQRLVLRPFGAASLRSRIGGGGDDCRLLVDILADEADLTVVVGGQVVFIRTVRLPQTDVPEAFARAMQGESRRTIAAAQSQLGGRRVEKVTIFGSGAHHSQLQAALAESLKLDVELFDPFEHVHVPASVELPEHHGRFAPLLGMLCDELQGDRHQIDFLNPRKKPAPPSKTRQNYLIGTLATILVVAIAGSIGYHLYSQSQEIAQLTEEINDDLLKRQIDVANAKQRHTNLVEDFFKKDVNWLDELYRISDKYPNPDEAILASLRMQYEPLRGREGGKITARVRIADANLLRPLVNQLKDITHLPKHRGVKREDQDPQHPWIVTQEVSITNHRLTERVARAQKKAKEKAAAEAEKKAAAEAEKKAAQSKSLAASEKAASENSTAQPGEDKSAGSNAAASTRSDRGPSRRNDDRSFYRQQGKSAGSTDDAKSEQPKAESKEPEGTEKPDAAPEEKSTPSKDQPAAKKSEPISNQDNQPVRNS